MPLLGRVFVEGFADRLGIGEADLASRVDLDAARFEQLVGDVLERLVLELVGVEVRHKLVWIRQREPGRTSPGQHCCRPRARCPMLG